MSYVITEEQKKILMQISAQTLPDNPSRDGYSAETIRKRLYKPTEKLIDLINSVFGTVYSDFSELTADIKDGKFSSSAFAEWDGSYEYGKNDITFYPVGDFGAFVKSVADENKNHPPYLSDYTFNSAYWELIVDFNVVSDEYFKEVQEQVEKAYDAATVAVSSAENLKDVSSRIVKFVNELPVSGDPKYIYAVVSDQSKNLFDLWAWVDGNKTYFGSANIVANATTQHYLSLKPSDWINKQQSITISGLSSAQRVSVVCLDISAEEYVKSGISTTLNNNTVTFSCISVPQTLVSIILETYENSEIKNYSQYYTKSETDTQISDAINAVVDGAPEAFDTFKEVSDWIKNDEQGTAALINRVAQTETNINKIKSGDEPVGKLKNKIKFVKSDGSIVAEFDGSEAKQITLEDGGLNFTVGNGLKMDDSNILSVNSADSVEQNNTLPITSAAVYTTVGNIDELLKTI